MKKLLCFVIISAVLSGAAGAEAYTAAVEPCCFFSPIDDFGTDGKTFIGVCRGKIAVSGDFESWNLNEDFDGVLTVQYINGSFCAVCGGVSLISSDSGASWTAYDNNLPSDIRIERYARNGGSIVIFVNNENGEAGTYQSYDGVSWNRVEGIPEGIRMEIINGKFVFFSNDYMRGLYFSDTGEEFTHVYIEGFDKSYGGCCVSYSDGLYRIADVWSAEDGAAYAREYYSDNLVDWSCRDIPMPEELIGTYSSYAEIGGVLHCFSANGNDYVYENGEWTRGGLDMYRAFGTNPAFLDYSFTECGILARSGYGDLYYLTYGGDMRCYDYSGTKMNTFVYAEDGYFYAQCLTGENESVVWQSSDGLSWERSSEARELPSSEAFVSLSGSNGCGVLTSEFIERGSRGFYPENEVITAELTAEDGTVKKIAYENAKGDCVNVIGGNGFFLLGNLEPSGGYYYSSDGITRSERITFPDYGTSLVQNGEYFFYSGFDGTYYRGSISQFENLTAQDAVRVTLNGEYLSFAAQPIIEDDRTFIPIRFLFERAGALVDWIDEEKAAVISYSDNTVKITVGADTAQVNGENVPLDAPARIINDKTLVPLRFISESIGFDVEWDGDNMTAKISSLLP